MLIDTNIIFEIFFGQKRQDECKDLLKAIKNNLIDEDVYMTRFSLSAIEAACGKRHKKVLADFLILFYQEKIKILELDIRDDLMINAVREDIGLDFDDAMQYVAAQRAATYIVTFDKDFYGKHIKIKTPKEILKEILVS